MKKVIQQYAIVTFGTFITALGVYAFKFPNNFAFGGATGLATILSPLINMTPSTISFILNIILLVVGCIFLGKSFGAKTIYASLLFTVLLSLMEYLIPITEPLTTEPILELAYAIALPAAGSALLLRLDASSGGTEIIAMILKKYTRFNIGISLLFTDMISAVAAYFVFGIQTGLFSTAGLIIKSLIIDSMIASLNMNKYFTIVCDNPEPILAYINDTLHHGSTVTGATGSYTGSKKTIIYAAVKKKEAYLLKKYVKKVDPNAFLFVTNSSEIIGKGFLSM